MSQPALFPSLTTSLPGKTVALIPLQLSHVPDLYTNLCGEENNDLYTYLPFGPFPDLESFTEHIEMMCKGDVFYPYAVMSSDPKHLSNANSLGENGGKGKETAVAIISLMAVVPADKRIEIGTVLYPKTMQRSIATTETTFLLARYAIEELGYQRVEWKTDSRNVKSRRAAERLGFLFEGIFRKHMVVRGGRRDTAWFSIVDEEWSAKGGVKEVLEVWLREQEGGEGQKRRLEVVREEIRKVNGEGV